MQTSFAVLQKLFYLLENYAALSVDRNNTNNNNEASADMPRYSELASWALLVLRYIAPADGASVSNSNSSGGGGNGDGNDAAAAAGEVGGEG